MKLNINKYIFFYIILVFISLFFYLNIGFFKLFFSNYNSYFTISHFKNKSNVAISWNYIIYNSWFLNIDISNFYLLNKNITWAKQLLYNLDEYSYKELYNLWNIYFLDSYYSFSSGKTWYVNKAKQSISFYENSLENIPWYKSKEKILKNLWLSQAFLDFLYVYNCDNLFVSMIEKINNLIKLLPNTMEILKSQQLALNERLEHDDLRSCIQSFKNEADKNISILYDNKDFFTEVSKWLINRLKKFQWDELSCYQQSPAIKSKYKDSIDSSYDYYTKFFQKQKDMLKIFEKANKQQIEQLCNNRDKLADKQNKENQQMNNNFNDLNELTEKPQQQEKKEPKEWEKKGSEEDSNQDWEKEEKNKKYNEQVQSLETQNKDLIEQIQRNKTQDNYNPLEYIQELFKEFYANDEDFKKGQKENEVWK